MRFDINRALVILMEEHFTMSRQAMFCETLCLCLFLGTKWIHRHKQPGDLDNSDNLDNLDTIWTIQTITFGFFASTTTFGFFASTASRCPPHAFHEPSAGLDGTVDGASGGVCLSQLDLPVCTIVQRTCAQKATCACDLISIAHWSY